MFWSEYPVLSAFAYIVVGSVKIVPEPFGELSTYGTFIKHRFGIHS